MQGVIDSFDLPGDYSIVEARTPAYLDGMTLKEAAINRTFHVIVLTTIRLEHTGGKNGSITAKPLESGIANSETVLRKDEIIVVYGKIENIRRFLKHLNRG